MYKTENVFYEGRNCNSGLHFVSLCVSLYAFLFRRKHMSAFKPPDNAIIKISNGARIIPGIPSNKIPEPNLYKCPFRRIVSPMYMASVTSDAASEGTNTESAFLLPRTKELVYVPAVIPRTTKNRLIREADNADTVISPFLKKAVKHARIQSPRNVTVHTDWITSALRLVLSPLRIILANPYKQLMAESIRITEII